VILLNRWSSRHKACSFAFMGLAWLLLCSTPALAQEDWIHQVHTAVEQHQVPSAMAIVDHRLADAPLDMEAHSWRGRLLAWTGRWQEAEIEYQLVLDTFPNDEDVLIGLADVLLWQQKYAQSLAALEKARSADPQNPEILLRRAQVLSRLQRIPEARAQFQALLSHDPANRSAINGLANLTVAPRYELRIAEEADFFSYTENAQVETVTLTAHWSKRWTTGFGISPYHLFGENAV
jgi:tetratricopeptide (TPR) repeat protein